MAPHCIVWLMKSLFLTLMSLRTARWSTPRRPVPARGRRPCRSPHPRGARPRRRHAALRGADGRPAEAGRRASGRRWRNGARPWGLPLRLEILAPQVNAPDTGLVAELRQRMDLTPYRLGRLRARHGGRAQAAGRGRARPVRGVPRGRARVRTGRSWTGSRSRSRSRPSRASRSSSAGETGPLTRRQDSPGGCRLERLRAVTPDVDGLRRVFAAHRSRRDGGERGAGGPRPRAALSEGNGRAARRSGPRGVAAVVRASRCSRSSPESSRATAASRRTAPKGAGPATPPPRGRSPAAGTDGPRCRGRRCRGVGVDLRRLVGCEQPSLQAQHRVRLAAHAHAHADGSPARPGRNSPTGLSPGGRGGRTGGAPSARSRAPRAAAGRPGPAGAR